MTPEITGILVACISGGALLVISIFMLMGKGGFLIAGYNTMSEIEKAQYDEVAMSKFMGKILLPIAIIIPVTTLAGVYDIGWLFVLFIAITIGLVLFAIIYSNTKKRFRK